MTTPRVANPYSMGRGKKPKQPPAGAAQRIEALAADGFSVVGVARALGTSADTLRRWLDEHPELREAFDAGREVERQVLHNMLYRAATEKGNIIAALFLLKSRHGYVEGDQRDTGNKVSITFNLPGALSPVEFLKAIEHEPANTNIPVSAKSLSRS